MNKIWFFGDCFTYGYGCRPNYEYYQKYYQPGDKIWIEIVSDTLQRKMVDCSMERMGTNFHSLKSFSENLSHIGNSDIVVYGTTPPDISLLKLNNKKTKVVGITTYNLDYDKHWRDEQDKRISNEYIDLNMRHHQKKWMDWFLPQIEGLAYELLNRGVKTYLWSHEVYHVHGMFESITYGTNKQMDDYHFSFKGHRQMAQYILDKIRRDDHIKKSII